MALHVTFHYEREDGDSGFAEVMIAPGHPPTNKADLEGIRQFCRASIRNVRAIVILAWHELDG